MHHRLGPVFLAVALSVQVVAALHGQAAPGTVPARLKPAVGVSVDRFYYEQYRLTAISFRYSQLKPNTAGTELGVAIFPDVVKAGAFLLAPDIGAAYNVAGGDFNLLLKGGISTLFGVGVGIVFEPGFHLGSGLLLRTGNASGVRVDVLRHTYLIEQEAETFWSVGIGFTSLPRRGQ